MIPLKPDAAPADVADFRPHLWLKACLSVELTSGPGGGWSRTVGKSGMMQIDLPTAF